MRNKLRQYAQAKQKDPGEELVDSAVAAGSAVARGIGRGLMSGFKMAKQAAENSNKKKGTTMVERSRQYEYVCVYFNLRVIMI